MPADDPTNISESLNAIALMPTGGVERVSQVELVSVEDNKKRISTDRIDIRTVGSKN